MDTAKSIHGVEIRLTRERWEHITSGHPKMSDFYSEILSTLKSPDAVYAGRHSAKIAVKKLRESFRKAIVVIYKEEKNNDGFSS